jgi:hypothetical protein
MAAQQATLPPLQSVIELTTAYKPPSKSLEAPVAEAEVAETATETATATKAVPLGRQLADGTGVLADGTKCVMHFWEHDAIDSMPCSPKGALMICRSS